MTKIVVVVIAILIAVGCFLYLKQDKDVVPPEEVVDVSALKYNQTYTLQEYKFTFSYPEGFRIGEIDTEEGDTVTISDTKGEVGVQINISPIDSEIKTITIQDVKDSLPSLIIKESQDVIVGSDGKGVAFIADGTNFGTSREVWFVQNGYLYQMSTYLRYDEVLRTILNSWKFT